MRVSQAPSLDVMKASVLSARGDLIMRGAAVPERLAAGIMDNMLVSNGPGADLTWEYNNIFMDINNIAWRTKIIDIGVWDMVATPSKLIAHGLGLYTKILFAKACIYADDLSKSYPLTGYYRIQAGISGSIEETDNTNINLIRKTGRLFDDVAFDDGVMNRGKIFIFYLL